MSLRARFCTAWSDLFPDLPWASDEASMLVLFGEIAMLRAVIAAVAGQEQHPMRSREEIQRAHDIVTELLLDRELFTRLYPAGDWETFVACANVLCWTLKHTENRNFETMVSDIVSRVAEASVGGQVPEMTKEPIQ